MPFALIKSEAKRKETITTEEGGRNESTDNIKKGLFLFSFFFRIGWYTFGGGWSILVQLEREFVDKRQWITKQDLLDMIAMGKMSPGLMVANISMMFGYSVAGVFGGVCAVCGMACPAIIVMALVTAGYEYLKEMAACSAALRGVRSALVPIIATSIWSLGVTVFKSRKGTVICVIALLLKLCLHMRNTTMILAGIAVALLYWGGRRWRNS